MLSSNPHRLFTLMMVVTMGGLNLCMANPVNKGNELIINEELPTKLKERLFNMTIKESEVVETERVMEDTKPETGAVFIKEEDSKKKPASWETAK